jgi:hypothetical protein
VGKVAYRGHRRAERLADFPFEDIELTVAEKAELESEVYANEKSTVDAEYMRDSLMRIALI